MVRALSRDMTNIGSDSEFRDGFLRGAARAFFVCAYAEYCEENEDLDLPRPGPGGDWYDSAPDAPPNAYALAGELWSGLEHANPGACGVYTLRELAEKADGETPDPEEFGGDLAMQAMGHGISWFDDHKAFPIQIPRMDSCGFAESTFSPEE
jgi:hypothetical protein